MRAVDDWLEFVLLVLSLCFGAAILVPMLVEFNRPIVSYTEDKTAMDVSNALYVGENAKTGSDILMGLLVTDEYCPFPKSIRINDTPVIDLDKGWLANKYSNINKIYSATGEYKLQTMLDWKIKEIRYVDNNKDAYLNYILEEN